MKEYWLNSKDIAASLNINEVSFINNASKRGTFKNVAKKIITTAVGRQALYDLYSFDVSYQEKLKQNLSIIEEKTKANLEIANIVGGNTEVIRTATEIINQSIDLTLPYIEQKINNLTPDIKDIERLQTEYKCGLNVAARAAMAWAVIRWTRNEFKKLHERKERQVLSDLVVRASESPAIVSRMQAISTEYFFSREEILPIPRGVNNKNAEKKEKTEVISWLTAQLATGNIPKIAHIKSLYDAIRVEKSWSEITIQTLYNYKKEIAQDVAYATLGEKKYRLENALTVNRALPQNFGEVWSMDGTPANLWVIEEGKVRQSAYKCVCVDVATQYITIKMSDSKTESTQLYIDCFKKMVRETGFAPMSVEVDYFSGYKEFEKYLNTFGIQLHTYRKGNARAKMVEAKIGNLANAFERYNENFNGLNMVSREGRLSDEYREEAIANAMSKKQAKEYLEVEQVLVWNNHTIEQLEGKPCGKTPQVMFVEKTQNLEKVQKNIYYQMVGNLHTVKLTKEGLVLHHQGYTYAYLMNDIANNVALFFNRHINKKYNVYVLDYEADSLVCDVLDNKIIGYWSRKGKVEYTPTLLSSEGAKLLQSTLAVQEAQVNIAKGNVKKAKDKHKEDTNVQDFMKSSNAYSSAQKDTLNEVEESYKKGSHHIIDNDTMVDTETGEIIERKSKNENIAKGFTCPITGVWKPL
jgi:hypothetical protein